MAVNLTKRNNMSYIAIIRQLEQPFPHWNGLIRVNRVPRCQRHKEELLQKRETKDHSEQQELRVTPQFTEDSKPVKFECYGEKLCQDFQNRSENGKVCASSAASLRGEDNSLETLTLQLNMKLKQIKKTTCADQND